MNLALNLAFGKRKSEQDELFIPTAKAASSHGHPFYARLNHVLAETGFDEFVEKLCARYYKEGVGPEFQPLPIGAFHPPVASRARYWPVKIAPRMSRPANSYGHATAESFMATLRTKCLE
ncbi:MAG TPA: hypothetical protein VFB55_08685 [Verrucomicrobiae bacterium]|nr:hypothetical protein [Verrucomicrobiae bacterium]